MPRLINASCRFWAKPSSKQSDSHQKNAHPHGSLLPHPEEQGVPADPCIVVDHREANREVSVSYVSEWKALRALPVLAAILPPERPFSWS